MQDKIKLFYEIDEHLTAHFTPSQYLSTLRDSHMFREVSPFKMLGDLVETDQNPTHHPEGSVWNHTLMVVDEAAKRKDKSEDARAFMWAALLHDIGKAPTTRIRKGRITSYDHDKVGRDMAIKFLSEFGEGKSFIDRVSKIVRWHMQILFVVKDLPFAELDNMLGEVSAEEIALFSLCDRLGRGRLAKEKELEEKRNIEIFLDKCNRFLGRDVELVGGGKRR